MIRLPVIISMLMSVLIASADDYMESFNVMSDNYQEKIQDVQIIRPINGGTVLIPIFDDSCPEELKAPFSYACKIVEEYMPTCLPLQIAVSCGEVNSSTGKTISKVVGRIKENFGNSTYYNSAQMSVIKGVILEELCHGSSATYLDYVPNVKFLTEQPDIKIRYNDQLLNEISFSLATDPGQRYDFVTIAIRDLLIGLGISHSFRYNRDSKQLQHPSQAYTPFEKYIDGLLGNHSNPALRLAQATKGELTVKEKLINGQDLKLYAPSPWKDKTSLNYFIPIDGCCISSILGYDLCKGQVFRSLSDNHSNFFFRDLLGWKPSYTVSTTSPSSSSSGNTSLLMPFNGSLMLDNQSYISYSISEPVNQSRHNTAISSDIEDVEQYIDSFNPTNPLSKLNFDYGHAVSILMKDGSWDTVELNGETMENTPLSMSNWNLHYDSDRYARSVDGYLRARMTRVKREGSRLNYKSTYFVVDYLPQKVALNYSFLPTAKTKVMDNSNATEMVRIYFSDTEGIDRIVLERLRQGSRVPSKIDIPDYKTGYYDTTVDKVTTFTAVGYNSNGTSRSLPITITPSFSTSSLSFDLNNQHIKILSSDEDCQNYQYEITSMNPLNLQYELTGSTTGSIDISNLQDGLYFLVVKNTESVVLGTYKFKK